MKTIVFVFVSFACGLIFGTWCEDYDLHVPWNRAGVQCSCKPTDPFIQTQH